MTANEFPVQPGTHRMVMKQANGETLRYALFIPEGYRAGTPTPIVMALHYGGPVSPYYGQGYMEILVQPAFKDLGAVIAAPDCPTPKGWDSPAGAAAVLALMDHLHKHMTLDKKRTLLTGFSMGGMGTWYLAARYPERFPLAVPVSGIIDADSLNMIKAMPIYVIHSDKDEIFPFKDVEIIVEQLQGRNIPVTLIRLKGISHYNTNQFVPALRDAVPWIKKHWDGK